MTDESPQIDEVPGGDHETGDAEAQQPPRMLSDLKKTLLLHRPGPAIGDEVSDDSGPESSETQEPDEDEEDSEDDFVGPDSIDFGLESLEELSQQLEENQSWVQELIGQTFEGRYIIERELARGGMGVVYLGRQTNLNRAVVVKVISKYFVDGPDDLERFEQEAMGLSALQHPNIVTIYDFGSESGLSYIAMEHIEGETLEDRLARTQALTMAEFVRIAPQVLRAIGAAHDAGIIHRDIKPSNVMLTSRNHQDDFVKVVDFGLVKLLGDGREITGKGLVGTFGYVSPEQILGEPYDARSDVYALGVLFYHMLAGRKPFEDPDGMSVLYKHVNEEPPPLRSFVVDVDLPDALVKLIHQCLEKDSTRRPRTANEVLEIMVRRGLVPDEDSSGPWASGEYPRHESDFSGEVARRSLVTPLALVLAILVLVMFVTRLSPSSSSETQQTPPVEQSEVAQKGRAEQYVDEAQRLADQGKWSSAAILLRRADEAPGGSAQLLQRSVELENRIAVGQLLEGARLHADAGRNAVAIDRFEEVLRRDPKNAEALEGLARLHPPQPDADPEEPTQAGAKKVVAAKTGTLRDEPTTKARAPRKTRAQKPATKKADAEPKKAASKGTIESPRLPSQLRVQNRRMLEQMLRRVESEATDRNHFPPIAVQNSTRLLFKAAADDLQAGRQPSVSPRKIYYMIAHGVQADRSRDAIATELERAYRSGSLQ